MRYWGKLVEAHFIDIKSFYVECKNRNLCAKRIKNTLALLNQLLKYYQNRGIISKKCVFQVKRLTNENKFDESRIVFEWILRKRGVMPLKLKIVGSMKKI